MYRVVKAFRFEAAHQLDSAFSAACSDSIHGHSYKVEVCIASRCLNGEQMVLDFSIVKAALATLLENWDHALILSDKLAKQYSGTPSKKIVALRAQPTAEVMAALIFEELWNELVGAKEEDVFDGANGVHPEWVRVWETETCYAEFQPDGPRTLLEGQ